MSRLVLVRHGQSIWNLENRFTGWTDVPLTEAGAGEARTAADLMASEDMSFDVVHTSVLRRAIGTANIALDRMDLHWIPVRRSWRINERHYGALQGLEKKETAAIHGAEQVFRWRRSYFIPPPPLDREDPRHPRFDARYASVSADQLPASECLADVVTRAVPYWEQGIVPDLRAGLRILVVAHGNSIRALLKYLKRNQRRGHNPAQHPDRHPSGRGTGLRIPLRVRSLPGRPGRSGGGGRGGSGSGGIAVRCQVLGARC